jgi:lysophospholipase L1-like esterase
MTNRLEGVAVSVWSSSGMRGEIDSAARKRVVLAIGDSFTEALQVADEETYTALVSRTLCERMGETTVANLGRSGTSVADYISLAPLYQERFKPIWTIVQLGELDLTEEAWDMDGARLLLNDEGKLDILRATYVPVEKRSIPWRCMHWAEAAPLFNATKQRNKSAIKKADYPVEIELDLLVAAYGKRLTILWITPNVSLVGLNKQSTVDLRVAAYCKKNNVSFVTPQHAYENALSAGTPLTGFANTQPWKGHWNSDGHAAIARLITSELEQVFSAHGIR